MMNRSKQDIWQIIKQTLLLSENPTKRQVWAIIFIHAMVIAIILVCVFLHLGWYIGGIWLGSMAQALIVGLTDNSDRYIWQIVNQFFRRTVSPTKSDKRIAIVISIIMGLLVLAFLIASLVSGVLWLLYGTFLGPIAVLIAAHIWRVWNIARQIKAHRQQEEIA